MDAAPDTLPCLTPATMIPDLLRSHPPARRVLDRYGLNGCGGRLGPAESVAFFARTHGVDVDRLLAELRHTVGARAAVAVAPAVADAPDPAPKAGPIAGPDADHADDAAPAPSVADTIYRRFFLGAIASVLTAGATWGAWLLWQIAVAGRFGAASVHDVNAHGQAQIYGWVGLFIMGFAYQAFPRMWHTRLAAPRLAAAAFALMVFGIIVRTVGMAASGAGAGAGGYGAGGYGAGGYGAGGYAVAAAMAGGAAEGLAVLLFVGQLLVTFRRSGTKWEPYVGFVLVALFWFVAQVPLDVWHTYVTLTAATPHELVWYVSTYQAPLRDMQIHGLALFMILGVSIRMLPALFDVPPVPDRRGWRVLILLTLAVAGEVTVFVAYRWSGNHAVAALLLVPWLMLAGGCALIAVPWRLWRSLPVADRSGKFVRAAYAWLGVSLLMLLLLPAYLAVSGIPFSHAYYGAVRHAITVGFISLMIMGMAAKVVPTLNGVDARTLPSLWGPFLLVNAGCLLRVSLQTLTDWHPGVFAAIGVSGVLEVIGLGWWGAPLAGILFRGAAGVMDESSNAPRPDDIAAGMYVADVLRWFPQTGAVFDAYGFALLRNPIARRTMARGVTVAQAAAFRGIDVEEFRHALGGAAARGAN
jgi:hypothetical protein